MISILIISILYLINIRLGTIISDDIYVVYDMEFKKKRCYIELQNISVSFIHI